MQNLIWISIFLPFLLGMVLSEGGGGDTGAAETQSPAPESTPATDSTEQPAGPDDLRGQMAADIRKILGEARAEAERAEDTEKLGEKPDDQEEKNAEEDTEEQAIKADEQPKSTPEQELDEQKKRVPANLRTHLDKLEKRVPELEGELTTLTEGVNKLGGLETIGRYAAVYQALEIPDDSEAANALLTAFSNLAPQVFETAILRVIDLNPDYFREKFAGKQPAEDAKPADAANPDYDPKDYEDDPVYAALQKAEARIAALEARNQAAEKTIAETGQTRAQAAQANLAAEVFGSEMDRIVDALKLSDDAGMAVFAVAKQFFEGDETARKAWAGSMRFLETGEKRLERHKDAAARLWADCVRRALRETGRALPGESQPAAEEETETPEPAPPPVRREPAGNTGKQAGKASAGDDFSVEGMRAEARRLLAQYR